MQNLQPFIIDQYKRVVYFANCWIEAHRRGERSAPIIHPIDGEGIDYKLTRCVFELQAGIPKIHFFYTHESQSFTFTLEGLYPDISAIHLISETRLEFFTEVQKYIIMPGAHL
ncbi:hypothetical protein [Rheinheimera sp.]|uniref:hypothetical protein n=1 Tax=Rheinheimera sp. TaxID=1869214 RepID=UPI004047C819